MAGFLSPSILFLSTWDEAERDCLRVISKALLATGRFDRVVEPCAGAFVMPRIHRQAGWSASAMEMSDVSLFTSTLGKVCSGGAIEELGVHVDGKPLPLSGNLLDDASLVLYEQLRLRLECKPEVAYWLELRKDLEYRRAQHLADLRSTLAENASTFRGCSYFVEDMWSHMRRVSDDERVIVSINPPTYRAGFERFFDTKGRLTWSEPAYEVFDAAIHQYELAEEARRWKALMLCQQQCEPGKACETVIHARDLSRGQIVVVWTNQPDVVEALATKSAVPRRATDRLEKLPLPIVDRSFDVSAGVDCWVVPITPAQARYCKDLWVHKLDFKQAGLDFAVVVDGRVVGIAGYDLSAIYRPYHQKWMDAAILSYAVGAPHEQRLTRLVTQVALCRGAVQGVADAWANALAKKVVTVEYTRFPEAKGLRGLMKLESREKDDKYGQKLIYVADIDEWESAEALEEWKRKEQRFRKGK